MCEAGGGGQEGVCVHQGMCYVTSVRWSRGARDRVAWRRGLLAGWLLGECACVGLLLPVDEAAAVSPGDVPTEP